MDRENYIIKPFLNKFIGDDAALVGDLVYSSDLFCEDVHFKKGWLSYKEIGSKAMLVNISDTIVMNALPKYALLNLSIPKSLSNHDTLELSTGILEVAAKYGVKIIGGDTISDKKLGLCITIIGKIRGKPKLRKGAKIGDLLAFTGKLGSSRRGLLRLLAGGNLPKNHRFKNPVLRQDFFYDIASKIHCAMDISDGLAKDLSRLLKANQKGVKFIKRLSFDELFSGEEYELLLAFDPRHLKAIKARAIKARVKLNIFGKITRKRYKFHGKEHHF